MESFLVNPQYNVRTLHEITYTKMLDMQRSVIVALCLCTVGFSLAGKSVCPLFTMSLVIERMLNVLKILKLPKGFF